MLSKSKPVKARGVKEPGEGLQKKTVVLVFVSEMRKNIKYTEEERTFLRSKEENIEELSLFLSLLYGASHLLSFSNDLENYFT